jgi:hypothetical protein
MLGQSVPMPWVETCKYAVWKRVKAEKNFLHDVRTSRKIIFGFKDHATLLGDRVTLPYRRNVKSLEYVEVIKFELGDVMLSYHHGPFLNFKLENVDKIFF